MQQLIKALDSFFSFRSEISYTLGTCYYNTDFLKNCVNELRTLELKFILGEKPTYLEMLGIETLKNIAGLDVKRS